MVREKLFSSMGMKMNYIGQVLRHTKVLLVLDDVNDRKQLEYLAGDRGWYGPGSRIIITSRDRQVLTKFADAIYEVEALSHSDALQLFSLHAFRRNVQRREMGILSAVVADCARGVPLALKLLGSYFFGKRKSKWKRTLKKFRNAPTMEMLDLLRIIYAGLEEEHKDVFIWIAYFLNHRKNDFVIEFLNMYGYSTKSALSVLIDKCLIIISESNEIEVHDMLQEMGRQIFFEESEEPSTHIISKLLPSKKGKKNSKVITVPPAQAAPVKSDKRPKSVEMRSLYSEEEEEDIGNATQVIVNLQPLPPPFRTQLRRLMTMDEAGVETEKAVKGRSNIGPEPISGPEECTRKLKLLGLQDAKNEAAPSIGSGTGQHQSKASSAGTEPEIADIQHKPMQSGGTRKCKLEQPQDAENEVASSIGSGIDQHQCKALSLGTEPKIADIQHEPMQSGILSSLTQIDGPSKMLPEATLKCMGLPTPPECEEWQISTEIYLMDNEFSELPENLSCPTLKALFLNRNFRLRKIPESFFNNMPALHTLNISRTRIKSLPQSLFELVNLKKLFLNHCELLMKLQPEIGKLRNLETLDLEGTRITNLPSEVQHLTTLTCLKLSFDDPVNHKKELLNEVIPGGVFSALTKLKELHIDVSPNDKRWNACVVAIACEVRGLTTLDTLEFYFPCVELLSCFNWYNTEGESLSLSHFIFTVGHHIKRIMSRTPHNLELEMEQYDKCLKYVNGAGIPEEIKMVLRYATAFFLDRHTDITTLSEFGYENMMQLKWCLIGECNEIEAIINGDQMGSCSFSLTALEYLHIYRMKNLRSICEGRVLSNEFTSLRILTLRTCPRLTTIFAAELLTSFSNLEEIFVDDCPIISSIVSCYNSEYEATHFLPKLKKISLQHLPALASISNTNGISMPPTVEWMSFYCCPNLLRLPINKGYHTSLKKIEGERSWWEALEWRSTQQRSWDDIFVPINVCD